MLHFRSRRFYLAALGLSFLVVSLPAEEIDLTFQQNNLVSNIPGMAANTDPNLQNAWGVALSPTSPFWISDANTGLTTVYNGNGQPFPTASPLVVAIPGTGGGAGTPTGQVFNGTGGFALGGSPAAFIFASEDGGISAWNGSAGSTAVLKVNNAANDAIYKGLAIGTSASGPTLYAADFHNGVINAFDTNFSPTSLAGSFNDPNLPAGYAPFNIQALNGSLYVAYALQDANKEDDVPGDGNGFVDVFDMDGNLQKRLISGGELNSPWGLAIAPSGFSILGGDLLVGNFGNGWINVYNPTTGEFIDSLYDISGNPLAIDGLWALTFGNGGLGGDANTLYFTAGPNDETDGLFGSLQNVPEPATMTLLGLAGIAIGAARRFRR